VESGAELESMASFSCWSLSLSLAGASSVNVVMGDSRRHADQRSGRQGHLIGWLAKKSQFYWLGRSVNPPG